MSDLIVIVALRRLYIYIYKKGIDNKIKRDN